MWSNNRNYWQYWYRAIALCPHGWQHYVCPVLKQLDESTLQKTIMGINSYFETAEQHTTSLYIKVSLMILTKWEKLESRLWLSRFNFPFLLNALWITFDNFFADVDHVFRTVIWSMSIGCTQFIDCATKIHFFSVNFDCVHSSRIFWTAWRDTSRIFVFRIRTTNTWKPWANS